MERCLSTHALSDAEREDLILAHIPLLKHIVGRVGVDLPSSVDRDDLYGFGMLGLIAAADSWDPSRGLKFSTYAYTRVRGAMLDELRKLDFLPRGRRDKVRNVERAVAELEQTNGVPPTPEELAAHLDISLEDLDEVLASAKTAMEASIDEGETAQLGQLLSDPKASAPEDALDRQELLQALAAAVAELPEQEKSVITLYYAEELLLREISELLGVTESRVSQIHTRALYPPQPGPRAPRWRRGGLTWTAHLSSDRLLPLSASKRRVMGRTSAGTKRQQSSSSRAAVSAARALTPNASAATSRLAARTSQADAWT